MAETAGTKLRRARKLRQLSLEDASRATKIRLNQLADLEADEYSNFANLAYARSFLVGYAKYLHADVRPYLEAFADASTFGLDDYQYLSETPVGVYRAPLRQQYRRKPRRGQLVLVALAVGFMGITGGLWFLAMNYARLGDIDKLAARQEARERETRSAEASNQSPATAVPVQAPAVVIPVDAPLSPPDATPAPAVTPMDETARTAAAALASTGAVLPPGINPVAFAGDDGAARRLLKPTAPLTAGHPADAVHRDVSQPQKVSNNHPRE